MLGFSDYKGMVTTERMTRMEVVKRNGTKEAFNISKVEKVIRFACQNDEQYKQFLDELKIQLKNEISTKDLQKSLIQMAVEKTSVSEPHWDSVASKLYLYDKIKEAGVNREYRKFGYGNFYKFIKSMTEKGLYGEYILKGYKKSEIEELGDYIKPERDFLLTYVGIKTLVERYCVKGHKKEVYELPQEAYMGVAMALALAEKEDERVKYAKEFYDVMSQLLMTVATPTMSNARKPFSQLSSCFIGTVDDSLESIYNVNDLFAQVSKHGGGMGIYIGKVRAKRSDIRGFEAMSGGIVPWIKLINDTAIAVDQLGQRKGAVSVTLDIWHRDIFDFLELKTNNGDERRKAHDIFPAVSIPDLFMKQLREKGKFYLFCPHEVRRVTGYGLEDFYDDGVSNEFTKHYWECVENPDIPKIEVSAIDLLKPIIKSCTETGTPFLFFRDNVNRMNPNKHCGMIYSSNLCTEIMQNMSPNGELSRSSVVIDGDTIVVEKRKSGDFVVCNLASLNLGRTHTNEMIEYVVPKAIRMMDNVIDLNYYPVEEARITNKKYRAVGLGQFGYHHMLVLNDIRWESDEHLEFADKIYEKINLEAVKASAMLGAERGSYSMHEGSEWNTGKYFELRNYSGEEWSKVRELARVAMRNGYVMATAPNGSSSLYGGSTQSIDPIYLKFYYDEKKGQVVPIIAPDLNPKTMWLYKEANTIDQFWSIKANAVRQRHVDQSQSFNLYITPQTKSSELAKMYMTAWELGIKTIYYTRSLSIEVEECVSCSA